MAVPQANLSPDQFQAMHDKLMDPSPTGGGFTVNPRTGENITKGWSVADPAHEVRQPDTAGPAGLAAYHAAHQANWNNGAMMGGWHSGNEAVLDVVRSHPDTPGGTIKATHAMKKLNQDAIYNPRTRESYWNSSRSGKRSIEFHESEEGQENAGVNRRVAQARLKSLYPETYRKALEVGGFPS